jgi:NAD(P)-dependent dehydrogenase (short-subunit alcohol dehydrogenase family)
MAHRTALITGASRGIGRACAVALAQAGHRVVLAARDLAKLEEAAVEIRSAGGEAFVAEMDLGSSESIKAAIARAAKEFGGIDILVNAVGGSTVIPRPSATVDELALDEWKKIIDFNLDGTFLFTHAVVPVMKRQQSGKIVNLASIAGRGRSAASSSAYAAAKGGIIAFTKKLSYELGPYGININAIAPSTTLTERIRPHWERRSQEDQARAIDATPLRRVAEPVDQARVICFLASQDADFITGVTIDVTGGS